MDNYNKLFSIIRQTDLLNYDEKNELKLYLMNLERQVKEQKETIDKAINWTIKYQTEWCQEDEVIRDLKQLLDILKGEQNG